METLIPARGPKCSSCCPQRPILRALSGFALSSSQFSMLRVQERTSIASGGVFSQDPRKNLDSDKGSEVFIHEIQGKTLILTRDPKCSSCCPQRPILRTLSGFPLTTSVLSSSQFSVLDFLLRIQEETMVLTRGSAFQNLDSVRPTAAAMQIQTIADAQNPDSNAGDCQYQKNRIAGGWPDSSGGDASETAHRRFRDNGASVACVFRDGFVEKVLALRFRWFGRQKRRPRNLHTTAVALQIPTTQIFEPQSH